MQKIRMAAVGCGQAGYAHLETFMAQPEVSLTVAVDIDEKRLEEIGKKHNIDTSTDYRDVIKDDGINAVIIASSNETHPGIAIEAMKAGKHVFCEKPIAPTLEECRKVVSIARKHQRIFHTHFELRHSVVPVRIKEIIDSGEIGQIRSMNLVHYRGPFRPAWKGQRKLSGGLTLMETCHAIDLFRHLSGCDVEEVFSFAPPRVIPYYDYPDTEYLVLRMGNGIVSHITSCHTRSVTDKEGGFKDDECYEEQYGHQYEYSILGTKGSLRYKPLRGSRLFVYGFEGEGEGWDCVLRRTEDFSHISYNEQIHGSDRREFIDAVMEGRDTYITPEDSLRTHEVCFAVEESGDSGGRGIVPDRL